MTITVASPRVRFAPRTLARIAGVLYLLLIGAAFNEGFVVPRLVHAGDATTTADDIRASAALFRFGVVGDLLAGTIWLLLAMSLYLLLRHVHQLAAAAMVAFAAVGCAIQVLNQLNQYTALTIATDGTYTHAFGSTGANGLTLLFAGMQQSGYLIDAMFFGLWLLPLGYLVVKSGYFPRALGVLLIVGGFSYIADLFAIVFDLGGLGTILLVPAGLSELSFLLWLLIKGVPRDLSRPGSAANSR
ncbi:MAG TPA: DUF4386 domain-containing protein [Pseudonocardiaceae bacterium]